MTEAVIFLNLDGIPSQQPRGDGEVFFFQDGLGTWRLSGGDHSHEAASKCVELADAYQDAIMQGIPYEQLAYAMPQFVATAGLDSEAPVSSALFQEFLRMTADFPELNRFLYLHDCERLVSSIQECLKEISQITAEFYLALNTEPFFGVTPQPLRDGEVRFLSSAVTTKLFAFLNFLLIRMHSLMDYSVKVATEAERLREDFTKYSRMPSLSVQFGDRKRLGLNGRAGTLFEDCEFITTLETLRNHVIHDAMLDARPKAYERFAGGVAVERFILFPDMTAGRLDRYVNRALFFGKEDKINLRLPALVSQFHRRLASTLDAVLEALRRRHPPASSAAAS
jgi:hypothetical protein